MSVVIPMFNNAATVAKTMASVAAQSCPPEEVVAVDDGSSDESAAIVRAFHGRVPRLRLVSQARSGAATARNRGIEAARGTWIAFLDADDLWLPQHLEVLVHGQAAAPRARLLGNDYVERGDADETYQRHVRWGRASVPDVPVREIAYFLLAAKARVPFYTSSVMLEKGAAVAAGGFPSGERRGEDLALWARIARQGLVAACGYVGAIYRRGSLSSASSQLLESADVGLRTYLALAAAADTPTETSRLAREAAYRLALAHAIDAVRVGRPQLATEVFLPIAAPTQLNRRSFRIVSGLAALPPSISRLLVGAWLPFRGWRGRHRSASGLPRRGRARRPSSVRDATAAR